MVAYLIMDAWNENKMCVTMILIWECWFWNQYYDYLVSRAIFVPRARVLAHLGGHSIGTHCTTHDRYKEPNT